MGPARGVAAARFRVSKAAIYFQMLVFHIFPIPRGRTVFSIEPCGYGIKFDLFHFPSWGYDYHQADAQLSADASTKPLPPKGLVGESAFGAVGELIKARGCRKNKFLSPASVSLSCRRHRRCRRHVGVAVMAQVVLEKPQAGRCSRVWRSHGGEQRARTAGHPGLLSLSASSG